MSVVFEVLMIAMGTAVLAAFIVVADWDLGVIRAWEAMIAFHEGPQRDSTWRHTFGDGPERSLGSPRDDSDNSEPRNVQPAPTNCSRTRADEWLAAAAAHRLSDFRPTAVRGPDGVTESLPAKPLREVLADARAVGKAAA